MKKQTQSQILDRFFNKVYPEPNTGCWLWYSGHDKDGYGQFMIDYKQSRAHRVSYQLFRGEIPLGMRVLHTCDVTSCVNPDHLFLGTDDDNMKDKSRKGRSLTGERNVNAKLKNSQVIEIRNSDESSRKIARKFGVDKSLILLIKKRRIWKHI